MDRTSEMRGRFLGGENMASIGRSFNISRERVRQLLQPTEADKQTHRDNRYANIIDGIGRFEHYRPYMKDKDLVEIIGTSQGKLSRVRRLYDLPKPKKPDLVYFEEHIKKGKCWTWTGALHSVSSLPIMTRSNRHWAHRWSYEHYIGEIPEGKNVKHTCGNQACVNPKHLRLANNGAS